MLAPALMLDFALDQSFQPSSQIEGGNEQFPIFLLGGVTGEIVKKVLAISSDLFVARKHPNIGVKLRGNAVVVPGREMDIAPDSVSFLAHHQSDFGMNLQTLQSVDHMYAFVLQHSCPLNVALFVEPG